MKLLQQGFKEGFEMVNCDLVQCNCNQRGPLQLIVAVIGFLNGNNVCEVNQSINHYDSKLNSALQF